MIVIDTKGFQDSDFESEAFIKLLNEHLPEEIKIKEIFRDTNFDIYPLKSTFSVIFSDSDFVYHFTKIGLQYPEVVKEKLQLMYNFINS